MLDLDKLADRLANYLESPEVDNAFITELYDVTESPEALEYLATKIGAEARDEALEWHLYGA